MLEHFGVPGGELVDLLHDRHRPGRLEADPGKRGKRTGVRLHRRDAPSGRRALGVNVALDLGSGVQRSRQAEAANQDNGSRRNQVFDHDDQAYRNPRLRTQN